MKLMFYVCECRETNIKILCWPVSLKYAKKSGFMMVDKKQNEFMQYSEPCVMKNTANKDIYKVAGSCIKIQEDILSNHAGGYRH